MSERRDWKILGIDHMAFPVRDIEYWKSFYVNVLGGTCFYHIHDANPDGKSSMKLCGIKLGDNVSIALVEGIDREEVSQVTKFVNRHGDHSVQHPALAVRNIEAFLEHLKKNGAKFMGKLLQREDPWGGEIKQIFAAPFDPNPDPDAAAFFEFVERPQKGEKFSSGDSFDDTFAQDLYKSVEDAGGDSFLPSKK